MYCVNMKVSTDKIIKCYATYQQAQPQKKTIPYHTPGKSWEVVGPIFFFDKNKTLLCIGDYHRKFPIVKTAHSLAADDLVQAAKIIFAKFRLPKKIISDAGLNFILDPFRQFCGQMNIE